MDKLSAAAEFIFAAERLIAREVTPELLPETERAAIEYYLECLSKQFWDSRRAPTFHGLMKVNK